MSDRFIVKVEREGGLVKVFLDNGDTLNMLHSVEENIVESDFKTVTITAYLIKEE